jgi:hypothetical protein
MRLALFHLSFALGMKLTDEARSQGLKLFLTDGSDAGGFDLGTHAKLVRVIIAGPVVAANHSQYLQFLLGFPVFCFVFLLGSLALAVSLLHLQQLHSQGFVLLLKVVNSGLEMPMLVASESRLASFRPNNHL